MKPVPYTCCGGSWAAYWLVSLVADNTITLLSLHKKAFGGFPGGAVVKNLPANAGDTGLSPGPGRSHMPRSN